MNSSWFFPVPRSLFFPRGSRKFLSTFANSRERKRVPTTNGRMHPRDTFGHVPRSQLSTFIFSHCDVRPSQARLLASRSIIVLIHTFLGFVSRHCILFQWFLKRILACALSLSNTPLVNFFGGRDRISQLHRWSRQSYVSLSCNILYF